MLLATGHGPVDQLSGILIAMVPLRPFCLPIMMSLSLKEIEVRFGNCYIIGIPKRCHHTREWHWELRTVSDRNHMSHISCALWFGISRSRLHPEELLVPCQREPGSTILITGEKEDFTGVNESENIHCAKQYSEPKGTHGLEYI